MRLSRLIGLGLAVGCALLLVVAVLIGTGVLGGVSGNIDAAKLPDRPALDLPEGDAFTLPEFDEAYAVISERPLFNDTRQPKEPAPPPEPCDDPPCDGDLPPPVPLDIAVRGIIITPDVKVALLTDNRSQEGMRIKEGMPLEGDLAGWTLTEIQPRKLIFDGEELGRAEVELQVHTQALAGGPAPAVRRDSRRAADSGEGEPPAEAGADEPSSDAEARAEEIRRRVAERREQLREEAERRRQLQQAEEQ